MFLFLAPHYLGITHEELHADIPESLASCSLPTHEEAAEYSEGRPVDKTVAVEEHTSIVRKLAVGASGVRRLVHHSLGGNVRLAKFATLEVKRGQGKGHPDPGHPDPKNPDPGQGFPAGS